MSRYEVEFSPKALASLREITHYIAQDAGAGRASDWLRKIQHSTVTLETNPRAFPRVGPYEGEDIHARFVMRHVVYYFIDEFAHVVTIVDVVHTARETERGGYEEG